MTSHPGGRPASLTLPFAPLEAVVEGLGGIQEVLRRYDRNTVATLRRAWARAQARGCLPLASADQLAVRLTGRHPSLVWSDEWWSVTAELAAEAEASSIADSKAG